MADKTLSQIVGGGGKEVGDYFRTKATVLANGRALLPCDGSASTGNPLLEALLPAGIVIAAPVADINTTGDGVHGAEFAFSTSNYKAVGTDGMNIIYRQYASTATNSHGNEIFRGVGIAADGVESIVSGFDSVSDQLRIRYNLAGAAPTTQKTIATDQYNDAVVVIKSDGTDAIVIANENNDRDTYVWGSDSGIGGTWSNTSITNLGGANRSSVNTPKANPTITYIVVFMSLGVWVTDDSGATWETTDSILPDGNIGRQGAINSSLDIYCVTLSANKVYKSTDDAATWTTFFDMEDHFEELPSGFSSPNIQGVAIDSSDNVYVMGAFDPADDSVNVNQRAVFMFYSEDDGTTWSYTRVINPDLTAGQPSSALDFQVLSSTKALSGGASVLDWSFAAGKVLPNLPGFKIVGD